ncbi:MAG: hypothetical protein HYU05_01815 [Candidatus Wildermuthbacteria bacterium]|nr:hypothetical protein [Candidatus Wildermuthbacteria bacterium]MBI2647952.1 hypothetical protein [Candidatus Wildermuthbacteria bacterium]
MMFPLSIFAFDREVFTGSARSLSVPGALGRMQILPDHIPIVSSLVAGEVVIEKEDGTRETLPIESGILEVNKKEVVALVNF